MGKHSFGVWLIRSLLIIGIIVCLILDKPTGGLIVLTACSFIFLEA